MVFPLRGADGEYRRFLTRVNPVRDSQGRVVHWFGTNTDVEDERRATEANVLARNQVNELREAAEAANRAKDEFLAMLGHELRNPLAAMTSALMLIERTKSPEQLARAMAVIDRQTRHLVRLVDDLLDLSRVSYGKIDLQQEPLDFVDLVRAVVDDHQGTYLERGILLELDVAANTTIAAKKNAATTANMVASRPCRSTFASWKQNVSKTSSGPLLPHSARRIPRTAWNA